MSKQKPFHTTCAKDGGANQSKTTLPPPSDAYRDNWDDIFRKKPVEERLQDAANNWKPSEETVDFCEKMAVYRERCKHVRVGQYGLDKPTTT